MKEMTTAQKQREILANNLNELLELKRKTQADVIRDTGFAETTVRSWFNGDKYPRLDKIQALADYFNVPRSRITEEQVDGMVRVSQLISIPVLGDIACGDINKSIYEKSHIVLQTDGHTHICLAGSWEYLVVYDLLVSLLLI